MRYLMVLLLLLFTSSVYGACGEGNTTNYSLCKPADGDTSWGANYRSTLDSIDSQMKTNADATGDADSDSTWTGHNDYPSACTNQFVVGIGDTLTCASVDSSDLSATLITGLSAVGTFESGDTFICNEAGVGLRECDYDDLPSGTGSGAPTDVNYLVGTADGDLSAEIVVGTSPQGELGGTWASPTVDNGIHDDEYIELTDNFAGEVTGTYGATVLDHDALDDQYYDSESDLTTLLDDDYVDEGQANSIDSDMYVDASIDVEHLADDIITHAKMADADQTDTKCVYIEDPTASDDLTSIWANKTANDFLLTEIWGESDQTVNFDLQIDDGTPADVNGTDLAPASGEAEDTSLSGDTTLASGEELDLVITSVSGTPTWVSICWTGNWVD